MFGLEITRDAEGSRAISLGMANCSIQLVKEYISWIGWRTVRCDNIQLCAACDTNLYTETSYLYIFLFIY